MPLKRLFAPIYSGQLKFSCFLPGLYADYKGELGPLSLAEDCNLLAQLFRQAHIEAFFIALGHTNVIIYSFT